MTDPRSTDETWCQRYDVVMSELTLVRRILDGGQPNDVPTVALIAEQRMRERAACRAQEAAIRQLVPRWQDEIRNGHGANRAGYERALDALVSALGGYFDGGVAVLGDETGTDKAMAQLDKLAAEATAYWVAYDAGYDDAKAGKRNSRLIGAEVVGSVGAQDQGSTDEANRWLQGPLTNTGKSWT